MFVGARLSAVRPLVKDGPRDTTWTSTRGSSTRTATGLCVVPSTESAALLYSHNYYTVECFSREVATLSDLALGAASRSAREHSRAPAGRCSVRDGASRATSLGSRAANLKAEQNLTGDTTASQTQRS